MKTCKNELTAEDKEKCKKEYGFYHEDLMVYADEKKHTVKIMVNHRNLRIIICHLYPNLRYSIFEDKIYLGDNLLGPNDQLRILERLETFFLGSLLSERVVNVAIQLAADTNKFNSLEEYFLNLPSTATTYIDNWLVDICQAPNIPINRIVGRKWLISCVARALNPGSYIEGSLIFYGKQAAGKTWLCRNLNPKPEWYVCYDGDLSNTRETALALSGKFIAELGELSALSKAKQEDIKRFMTETHDTYRNLYSKLCVTTPRMFVFAGSTNEPCILIDKTGNRRFWCVEVGKINQELFLERKEKLWAEALAAYKNGDSWILTEHEREMLDEANQVFEVDDPLANHIMEQLNLMPDKVVGANVIHDIAKKYEPKVHPRTLAKIMIKAGWTRGKFTKGLQNGTICYTRPTSNNEW